MRAVVCGAGIAGLAAAHALAARGAEVLVLERAPGPRTQGYMMDFFGPGYDAVEAMGLLPRIRELGYRVDELVYRDDTGRRRASLRFDRFAAMLDGRLVSIMRPDLELALRASLPEEIPLRYDVSVRAVDNRPDGVRLTLTDGSTTDADLLVGADGIHSTVRDLAFGPCTPRYLGFHTAAWVIDDAALHAEVAGRFSLTDTVDRQLGFYGLRGGGVAVFAVHRAASPARPADVPEALRREYAPLGWIAPRALAALPAPERIYYDQVAQIELPAWRTGRVVLIGDAAHAVSLLAGQGASLAIAGAWVLAEQLARAGDVDRGLAAYESHLRPLITDRQRLARDGVRWFLPSRAGQLRLRRAALLAARLPGVDRRVAAVVAGKPSAVVASLTR